MWIKIDDNLPDHPKIVTAGPEAAWLYICGLCFCNRFLTDGRIPERQLRRLVDFPNPRDLANRLIDVGLWEQADEGYLVHDYLEHQSSKEEVQEAQKRRADAGRLGGFAKAEAYRKQTSSKSLANARAMSEIISSKSLADKEEDKDKDKDTEEEYVCGAVAPRAQLAAAFWEAYPARNGKKLNKSQAMEGLKHIRDQDWPALMVAVSNYAESGQGPMDAFRFLQADRWREWLQPAATKFGQNRPPSKAAQSASFLTEVLQQSEAAIERRRQNGRPGNDRANGDSSEVFKHLNPGKRQTS